MRTAPFRLESHANAMFANPCEENAEIFAIDSDAIASIKGLWEHFCNMATAQAVFARFCGENWWRIRRASDAIASSSGGDFKLKDAYAHGMFAKACAEKLLSLRRDDEAIASMRGMLEYPRAAYDHAVLDRLNSTNSCWRGIACEEIASSKGGSTIWMVA